MQCRIDAHVHLRAGRWVGKREERFGLTLEQNGLLRLPDGGAIPLMPPYFHDSRFEADTLLALMDQFAIERAVIMQSLAYDVTPEIADAAARWPERIAGAMVIEPKGGWQDTMEYWYARGLRVVKYEMSCGFGFTTPSCYPDLRLNDPIMLEIFERAMALGLTVTVDPTFQDAPGHQPEALYEAARHCPELKFVICHLGFPRPTVLENREDWKKWKQMLQLAELPNVWFDFSAMPDIFCAEGCPWPTAGRLIRQFLLEYGPEKLIWGSDIPGTLCNATYGQICDTFTKSAALTDDECRRLYYQNAKEVYFPD